MLNLSLLFPTPVRRTSIEHIHRCERSKNQEEKKPENLQSKDLHQFELLGVVIRLACYDHHIDREIRLPPPAPKRGNFPCASLWPRY